MPSGSAAPIDLLVSNALGVDVVRSWSLAGGDVAASFRFELADGGSVFAKTHAAPPPGFFTTEAAGLSWMRSAGAVRVPDVLAVSDEPPLLVLEWIDLSSGGGAGRNRVGEAAFGRSLAELHRAGSPCFGREDRRTTGSRGLPNEPCGSWSEFFATQRLEPLGRLALDGDALDPDVVARVDGIARRLEDWGAFDEDPARLHGDLWAGNRVVDSAGISWLIDPAGHGGHREFDLAMMRLFGGFGPEAFDAYDDAWPLADGWEQRIPLHQLAPLMVHAIKFGGGYRRATEEAITAVERAG